jgi:hypothetical protein
MTAGTTAAQFPQMRKLCSCVTTTTYSRQLISVAVCNEV